MYQPQDLAIYIHWPFCKSKCPYCDFYKQVNPKVNQEALISEYIKALEQYKQFTSERTIKSIFFGGGTPSLIKPQNISAIINYISAHWHTASDIEISLEANPNTHYQTLFSDLKSAGINRLSLGLQALDEENLRFLGRTHNLATARCCLQEVVKTFDNHSADLIYALPHQTPQNWLPQLQEICSYGLKHLSLYQLTIEEGTVFARKGIESLNEDEAITIYNITRKYLKEHGYQHYEVSNFALTGYQSRHNLTYWQGGDYLGIGPSAHGRLCLNGQHYAQTYPFNHEELTPEERAEELIIMGLRLTEGIDKQRFKQICGLDFYDFINRDKLKQLIAQNLVIETPEHLLTSYDGFLLIDAIATELCTPN